MQFRIADTCIDSLAKLTGDEQKVVKTTAFGLQMKPPNPGMSFHKLDRARDKNFWSLLLNFTPWPERSRTFGTLIGTSPNPVWRVRSGRYPLWITARFLPTVCPAYWASSSATSASMACTKVGPLLSGACSGHLRLVLSARQRDSRS